MLKKITSALAASLAAVMLFTGCTVLDSFKDRQAENKTLSSLTRLGDGIYFMDCYNDYKVDDYLNANIKDVEQFDIWMTENLTHGVPTGDIPEIGCSSFAVSSPDGNHLFGRNYELNGGQSMIIRTAPEKGYASLGVVDLQHVNITAKGEYKIDDAARTPLLLAAPWAICDGINEKGLGVSLLQLNTLHVVTDTDKDDLLLYSALRVILDKCASVDEAVELLKNHDMYSPRPNSYHIFITDISGRSVVVEWVEGQLQVVEDNAVTNFVLYEHTNTSDPDMRYTKLRKKLDETSRMTVEEAMALLEYVTPHGANRWSAVYDLERFSVEVCFNEDFSESYVYSGRTE